MRQGWAHRASSCIPEPWRSEIPRDESIHWACAQISLNGVASGPGAPST